MNFNDVKVLSEENGILLEKRKYEHRKGYKGNEKGSYINKGKTKWDYSIEGATPGNERIVTQIQNKITRFTNGKAKASREDVKNFLKTDKSQKIFDRFKDYADGHYGDSESPKWRGYVFGGFTSAAANILIPDKFKKSKKEKK